MEFRTLSYSAKYLFAGNWHTVQASIDIQSQKVHISLCPEYKSISCYDLEYDGSRLLENIVDDYIENLARQDSYICIKREVLSLVTEFWKDTDILGQFSVEFQNNQYQCIMTINKNGHSIRKEKAFSFNSSIDESLCVLYKECVP